MGHLGSRIYGGSKMAFQISLGSADTAALLVRKWRCDCITNTSMRILMWNMLTFLQIHVLSKLHDCMPRRRIYKGDLHIAPQKIDAYDHSSVQVIRGTLVQTIQETHRFPCSAKSGLPSCIVKWHHCQRAARQSWKKQWKLSMVGSCIDLDFSSHHSGMTWVDFT